MIGYSAQPLRMELEGLQRQPRRDLTSPFFWTPRVDVVVSPSYSKKLLCTMYSS